MSEAEAEAEAVAYSNRLFQDLFCYLASEAGPEALDRALERYYEDQEVSVNALQVALARMGLAPFPNGPPPTDPSPVAPAGAQQPPLREAQALPVDEPIILAFRRA